MRMSIGFGWRHGRRLWLSSALGGMIWRMKGKWWVFTSLTVIVLYLRIAVPIPIEGDWTGQLGTCLCGHRNLIRFNDGRVTWYGHGGEPTKLKNWGTYQRTGWNTFQWLEPKRSPVTIHIGWYFSSFEGGFLEPKEVIYCWRYPFVWKAHNLYEQCEKMTNSE